MIARNTHLSLNLNMIGLFPVGFKPLGKDLITFSIKIPGFNWNILKNSVYKSVTAQTKPVKKIDPTFAELLFDTRSLDFSLDNAHLHKQNQ